jgi:hypothetical protein
MDGTVERPIYTKFNDSKPGQTTQTFGISVDEGWRQSILCNGMYERDADWLIEQIQFKPFCHELSLEGV